MSCLSARLSVLTWWQQSRSHCIASTILVQEGSHVDIIMAVIFVCCASHSFQDALPSSCASAPPCEQTCQMLRVLPCKTTGHFTILQRHGCLNASCLSNNIHHPVTGHAARSIDLTPYNQVLNRGWAPFYQCLYVMLQWMQIPIYKPFLNPKP